MAVEQLEESKRGAQEGSLGGVPLLWHLKVSHYNEKARWALDYKRVPHVRRAIPPGRHQRIAKRLTDGKTFPVLVIDGEAVGDSTRIIEALERRYPAPPLYPVDPVAYRRALELEEFFDEELGPSSRLLVLHHTMKEGKLMLGAFFPDLPARQRATWRALFPLIRRQVKRGFGIDERGVALAFEKLRAAGERFQAELQPSGYLVGDGFTVADLTLAALLAPPVAPEQFPYPQPQRGHPLLAPVRECLDQSGLLEWTREMYARHRGASAEIAA